MMVVARVRPYNDRERSYPRAVNAQDTTTLQIETQARPETVGLVFFYSAVCPHLEVRS